VFMGILSRLSESYADRRRGCDYGFTNFTEQPPTVDYGFERSFAFAPWPPEAADSPLAETDRGTSYG